MKQKGKQAFEKYYRSVCVSDEEFAGLMAALKTKPLPVLRFRKEDEDKLEEMWRGAGLTFEQLSWYPLAVRWPKEATFGDKLPGYDEKLIYPMSETSLLPVLAMDLKPDDVVLDACSAPGGKAVMIAERLGDASQLLANDLSPARAARMRRVFGEYGVEGIETMVGPAEKLVKRLGRLTTNQSRDISARPMTGLPDPRILGLEGFDKILVDAPCSSEAHVYRSPEHLKKWSYKRIEKLARRQVKMLESLVPLLKPGGRLVYSTCAVTPEENEGVVAEIGKASRIQLELEMALDNNKGLPGGEGREWNNVSFDTGKVKRVWPVAGKLEPMFVAVWKRH